jgi:type II secretory pathway pseudopilin PulG
VSIQKNSPARRLRYGLKRTNGGFSLFELVVFIICVAIIYAAAARRFSSFSGDAERANFLAVTTQLQAGISLESMVGITQGAASQMDAYVNSNPMDLLLEPPSNYVGAFRGISRGTIDRRSWYFETSTGELVYLANDAEGLSNLVNGIRVPTDEVRFSISAEYFYRDKATGLPASLSGSDVENSDRFSKKFSGLLLKPVIPFEWVSRGIEQNAAALAGS